METNKVLVYLQKKIAFENFIIEVLEKNGFNTIQIIPMVR